MQKTLNIAIVGLGVIGGSFAWALKEQKEFPVHLMGMDHDPKTLEQALQEGAIDYGETNNQTILQQADLVIITLYPNDIVNFVETHRSDFKEGTILTDTTGVKGNLVNQIQSVLPEDVDFIFGHPMAGKESQGFAYADGDTFQDANYLITPVESNKQENIELLTRILVTLGFKRVSEVNPQTHDEMIAFVSQLCHILAVSLINSDEPERQTAEFVGDTYRELTRIAKINAPLWTELFLYNKEELLKAMENFQNQFNYLKTAIEQENQTALTDLLVEATSRRKELEQADLKLQSATNKEEK
ncbi:prephenate dehydrogenase [Atopostipes suicloacalis DSM 15692]|uniref:Prephenate dehydrogenase n=1 Tax=Atopostipes suicloacalis DSM 15692 TaxID=1121025 RepID=A0A1M4WNZ9_9LACT|nr:prephenate dehydrogenase [Atopostipes suicloacalis]SHE82900.1 prephenate dehydrogenase [Atopostipes suicloacalis DSM 15692]